MYRYIYIYISIYMYVYIYIYIYVHVYVYRVPGAVREVAWADREEVLCYVYYHMLLVCVFIHFCVFLLYFCMFRFSSVFFVYCFLFADIEEVLGAATLQEESGRDARGRPRRCRGGRGGLTIVIMMMNILITIIIIVIITTSNLVGSIILLSLFILLFLVVFSLFLLTLLSLLLLISLVNYYGLLGVFNDAAPRQRLRVQPHLGVLLMLNSVSFNYCISTFVFLCCIILSSHTSESEGLLLIHSCSCS